MDKLNSRKNELGIQGYVALVGREYLVEYFLRGAQWTAAALDQLKNLKQETLNGIYETPLHLEAGYNTEFKETGLTRPKTAPFESIQEVRGAGLVNVLFEQKLNPSLFLEDSQASFARTPEEEARLKQAIKEAFLNGTPVPTRPD